MDKNISNILSAINEAEIIYNKLSPYLSQDNFFIQNLKKYEAEIEKSFKLMNKLELPRLCGYCATKIPGGGCCGEQIATWYDPILLSLNLFMGLRLQTKSYYDNSCIFLGRDGCTLKARYHFCVNYLCSRIYQALDEKDLQLLRSQYGKELFSSWQLEIFIKNLLKKNQND